MATFIANTKPCFFTAHCYFLGALLVLLYSHLYTISILRVSPSPPPPSSSSTTEIPAKLHTILSLLLLPPTKHYDTSNHIIAIGNLVMGLWQQNEVTTSIDPRLSIIQKCVDAFALCNFNAK